MKEKYMRSLSPFGILLLTTVCVMGQQTIERRVPLTDVAVAMDRAGATILEGTLRTTALHGSPDSPVTNIRVVLRNPTTISYAFVSGLITFYDASSVRCGEGIFKADALLNDESFETDAPGIRIRCSPATWRIVATNVLPRVLPAVTTPAVAPRSSNLIISVDGEEHPLQLDRPMVINVGNAQRTIVVREAP
jgi:hypothetical protein